MTSAYEAYGVRAVKDASPILASGRYAIQSSGVEALAADAIRKLSLTGDDTFLDIGCGMGAILLPSSLIVRRATGLDHPAVIQRLKSDNPEAAKRLTLVEGNFLNDSPLNAFDKICVYSVVHYLDSFTQVRRFVDKAVNCLRAPGRLLVGDIPNDDLKSRFLASDFGREFQRDWVARVESGGPGFTPDHEGSRTRVQFGDSEVRELLDRYRTGNTHAWIVPQPENLPFGHTREDLVIDKF